MSLHYVPTSSRGNNKILSSKRRRSLTNANSKRLRDNSCQTSSTHERSSSAPDSLSTLINTALQLNLDEVPNLSDSDYCDKLKLANDPVDLDESSKLMLADSIAENRHLKLKKVTTSHVSSSISDFYKKGREEAFSLLEDVKGVGNKTDNECIDSDDDTRKLMLADVIAANRQLVLKKVAGLHNSSLISESYKKGREEAMSLLETSVSDRMDSDDDSSKLMLADTIAANRQVELKVVGLHNSSLISESYKKGREEALALLGNTNLDFSCRTNESPISSNIPQEFWMEEEEWEILEASSSNEQSIERNVSILEHFLSKALCHDCQTVALSNQLRNEIRKYVSIVSKHYHAVNFHSFEHASHVMLSASKLVSMLPSEHQQEASSLSDPWLHFSICLAALLHDVDHRGMSNEELSIENNPVSVKYGSQEYMGSYAECNSIEIGMRLLERSDFKLFRQAIGDNCHSRISDLILCTDISSKERRDLCKNRWETRSSSNSGVARAIVDHIMQVADVSHTMQKFETFLKWNQRLYRERLAAYERRDDANISHPSDNWYASELGFFDFYIIPLAERLDTSGAFGSNVVNLAEKAKNNRARWLEEGKAITQKMIASAGNAAVKQQLKRQKIVLKTNRKKSEVELTFPEKLHLMMKEIKEEGWTDMTSFLPHGRAFSLGNIVRLTSESLPRYFGQSRRCFLERQLKIHGFTEISSGPDEGAYFHELFREGRPDLAAQIRRRKPL
mmetsp:Transcript_4303/g.6181  ORF Transcript_4303/g.6181 Transcript_4303/m.6181 type:complete len:734 (-) Transcript_4303:1040-3241(-)